MMRNRITIGIAGSGGDGVMVLGSFLQKLAAGQGYFSQMPRYYGAQIRGGGTAVKLSLDTELPTVPEDNVDIMVCFDWSRYAEFKSELVLAQDTVVLCDDTEAGQTDLPGQHLSAGFSRESRTLTGSALNKNIVALGLLTKALALSEERVRKAISDDEELTLLKDNLPAFEAGEKLAAGFPLSQFKLSPALDDSPRVIFHGNAAVARAAIRAGCRAFFGYPITPASEIMQEMQAELPRQGGVIIQAEDEIAAAGMAVGASLAGAKAMTATSGPGLDLMTETMGLASSAEIPLVIVDVQRCGTSTGAPSKSEQSDLNQAIYAAHGDTPRVVLAPYDIAGCYRLTIESFNIAEYYQTVVLLLSDQWLGQTLVAASSDFLSKDYHLKERKRPAGKDSDNYRRYQLTADFISPMAAVGDAGLVYQTTGLAHNEKGEPASNFETMQKMNEKRWQKLAPLRQLDELVTVFGEEQSSKGIITWGSSAQIVLETVRELGLQRKVKVCVPELIHPLPDKIGTFTESVERLLVIEMNYSGQLYHYLRSQICLPERTAVYARTGGRPFSRRELAESISELAG